MNETTKNTPHPPGPPILSLDFDGVLHDYKNGWQGPCVINGDPVPGAWEFLAGAVKHFTVCIFSSRSAYPGGIEAMHAWMLKHRCPNQLVRLVNWSETKPAAHVTLDDRAVTFTGTWPAVEDLLAFEPWNRRREK